MIRPTIAAAAAAIAIAGCAAAAPTAHKTASTPAVPHWCTLARADGNYVTSLSATPTAAQLRQISRRGSLTDAAIDLIPPTAKTVRTEKALVPVGIDVFAFDIGNGSMSKLTRDGAALATSC